MLNTIVELATALGNDSNYATTIQNQISNKVDKSDSYPKAEINVAIGILQAGIDNRVLTNTVDMNGKFKINATSNDILKFRKVDVTTLYDAFELSFKNDDKTSISTTNNVNLLEAINNNVSNTYSRYEVNHIISLFLLIMKMYHN